MFKYGTKDKPIRASYLPNLVCPMLFTLKVANEGAIAGMNAQTGNLIHCGIEAYHGGPEVGKIAVSEPRGIQKISDEVKNFPEGDTEQARRLLRHYITRFGAEQRGKVIRVEWKGTIEIPPSPIDPTKEAIYITGTIDQIRDLNEWFHVIDHKTGFTAGEDLLRDYALQLAAYTLIAHKEYKRPMKAFIARTQDLVRSNLPYWWEMPFTHETALQVLEPVRHRIALIRMGIIEAIGGKHCEWCPKKPLSFPGCVTGVQQARKAKEALQIASPKPGLMSLETMLGDK